MKTIIRKLSLEIKNNTIIKHIPIQVCNIENYKEKERKKSNHDNQDLKATNIEVEAI